MKKRTRPRSPSTKPARRPAKAGSPAGPKPDSPEEISAGLQSVVALGAETSEPPIGARPAPLLPVRIGYFQPDAREVFVAGTFNQWNPQALPLVRDAFGDWSVQLLLPPGEYRYRLVVDGEWRDDPSTGRTVRNPFGGFDSVIEV